MGRLSKLHQFAWLSFATVLVGCAPKAPLLYHWGSFPRQQYDTLLREGASVQEQIRSMEAQAEKARGSGANLPPGFRAHLGMLHLNAGNVDQARQLWQSEKVAFPESSPYMDQLLKRLESADKADKLSATGESV